MAYELRGMLIGDVNPTTWEKVIPAYGGSSESFLKNVVTPIYNVIREVFICRLCFFALKLSVSRDYICY